MACTFSLNVPDPVNLSISNAVWIPNNIDTFGTNILVEGQSIWVNAPCQLDVYSDNGTGGIASGTLLASFTNATDGSGFADFLVDVTDQNGNPITTDYFDVVLPLERIMHTTAPKRERMANNMFMALLAGSISNILPMSLGDIFAESASFNGFPPLWLDPVEPPLRLKTATTSSGSEEFALAVNSGGALIHRRRSTGLIDD